jgi:hypothetical protein
LIRFEAPARPASIRLARLLAAGVAATLDVTVEDLDDVAVAVDELCAAVIGSPPPLEGGLRLTLAVSAGAVSAGAVPAGVLCVEGAAPDHGQPAALSSLSSLILAAAADGSEVWREGGCVCFRLRCSPAAGAGRGGSDRPAAARRPS